MMMRTGNNNDEYTDYSCSTSIERLARDVETLLRSWHVDKGSDRHISMASNANASAASGAASSTASQGTTSTLSSTAKESSTLFSRSTIHNNNNNNSSLLLRSDVLTWSVSLTTAARPVSFTVELQLSLWDGPGLAENDNDQEQNKHSGLPHALRRNAQMTNISPFLFENFSNLFAIGQHITLTPTTRQASLQSLLQGGELQYLAQSILQRHDDEKTARWMLHQILSGWLQTALNSAVSNCHCCIPVFGLWSPYHPHTAGSHLRGYGGGHQMDGDLQVFPSWLQDIAHVDLPPPPRCTSRKQFLERQALQNDQFIPPSLAGMVMPTGSTSANFWCSFVPGCPTTTPVPRLTLWGNILLQHCPEDTVVLWCARHVFAWWKQPLQKASAFQLLFNPDNYHIENENNPYTAWRRRPKLGSNHEKPTPRITFNHSGGGNDKGGTPHHVIDLTGEYDDGDDDADSMQAYLKRFEKYQDKCRTMALSLLEQAAGASASEPMWGPVDDPVASIHATATWNGSPVPGATTSSATSSDNDAKNDTNQSSAHAGAATSEQTSRQPLLSFPLRIRSRHSMSQEDWVEMEESVEQTILDPLRSCQFHLQAWWDLETPVASLAATQRCVLAALIRTATLPDETLLKHITDDAVLEQWDNASGNVVASCLAQQAEVGPTTKALVDAMDWDTAAEDKMELRDAEVLVRHILQPDNGSNYPQPPTSPIEGANPAQMNHAGPVPHRRNPLADKTTSTQSPRRESWVETVGASESSQNDQLESNAPSANNFAPLFKSAPLGRLVSILCVHMARIRSPCSMAMLWLAFCHEIRMRWEHCIQLPHMNYVPGLDPSSQEMDDRNQGLTTLGVNAQHAAPWQGPVATSTTIGTNLPAAQSSNDFPGDHHCLIGQKLQVVNLCIELAKLEGQRGNEKSDKRPRLGEFEPENEIDGNSADENPQHNRIGSSHVAETSAGVTAEVLDTSESGEFQDAVSEEDLFAPESAAVAAAAKRSTAFPQKPLQARSGARCPVPGYSLVGTGDQLYAPYLQRPYPLTDDFIAERRAMLSRSNQQQVHKRLEVSYRLQKPKLLSDMRAFKAANPGAIFQDFINWYGNPANPLDDYNDTRSGQLRGAAMGDILLGRKSRESKSAGVKFDKASEAMQMLNETRAFWARTWEDAIPQPASEQKPLFDISSTVEMAIDFLETMHPAILLNQVMAVNVAVAYFTLVGAAKEVGVLKVGGLVQQYFDRLRQRTEKALDLLAGDATQSTSATCDDPRRHDGASSFVSLQVISVCDSVCNALSDTEVITARCASLLHKFPEQYDLVENLLRRKPGEGIALSDHQAQRHILHAIQKQQGQGQSAAKVSSSTDETPASIVRPALREYVLRNLDDSHPCQLSVRFGDDLALLNKCKNDRSKRGTGLSNTSGGGLIIALTKSLSE